MKLALAVLIMTISIFGQDPAHSVTLKWTDGINPTGTTYNVYRAVNVTCNPGLGLIKVNSNPITTLTWTDPTVTQNTTYCYSVRAYLNAVESIDSNLVTAVIPADLFAPTGLTAIVK